MAKKDWGFWSLILIVIGFWVVMTIFSALPAAASAENVGTTSANFLKIGINAQAVGMGEAVTALSGGVSFVGYNPASVDIKKLTMAATHTELYEGVRLEEVVLGIPFSPKSGIYLRGNGVLFDKTDKTDNLGNKLGKFSASSMSFGMGLYTTIGRLHMGIYGKAIRQEIDELKSTAMAADIGLRYRLPLPGVSLGLSALNVGKPAKFVTQEDELPMAIRGGVGYQNGFLKVGIDAVGYKDQDVFLAAGTELSLFGGLRLRAGYSGSSELSSPLKAGVGFRFSAFEVNYAFNPGNDFGDSHRVSLVIN